MNIIQKSDNEFRPLSINKQYGGIKSYAQYYASKYMIESAMKLEQPLER